MKMAGTIWRSLARNTRGSEIAETAMILPLLFMVFLAIFWFGQAFRIYGTLTHGARLGAEAAVAPLCTTCGTPPPTLAATNAQTAVYNALAAAHLDKKNLVNWKNWTAPTLCRCGNPSSSCVSSSRSCDGTVPDVCVQPNVQLTYPNQGTLGGMGTCGTSVSARYKVPYSFPIPFTSLNMNNMLIPGQAQMRIETQ